MRPVHRLFWPVLLCASLADVGAYSPIQSSAPDSSTAPEMSSRDTSATFQTKVNLVLIPVVVRDSQGHAVGNLKQENFQLFDKGKPQIISKFSVEKSGGLAIEAEKPSNGAEAGEAKATQAAAPERYVAYLFDDLHLSFGDLANARKAAEGHVATALRDTDRAAIFTTSGRTTLDFTDDRAALRETLARLQPQPMYRSAATECPDLSYYMADLIQNKNDQQALQAATTEVMICNNLNAQQQNMAQQLARAAASRAVSVGEQDTRVALSVFKDLVRRLSGMPGQRTLVFISPGFVTPSVEALQTTTEILDRAVRANVMISSLDARGVYTNSPDIEQRSLDGNATRIKEQYMRESALAQADVLVQLADGTGGTFFHNSNDLNEGFRRVASAPEYLYMLGFSPQNLKLDGTFHKLKVVVKNPGGLAVQARRGYYAPKHTTNPEDTAKAELQDAVFSREEMHDLPVELHTQFFKSSEADAKLTVLARVDLRRMTFRKVDGRNRDDLTVISALFDRNGNYLKGIRKVIEMRLRDETLARLNSGITVKESFDAKPGSYFVRLVVRDSEGQLMSAENGAVEIP